MAKAYAIKDWAERFEVAQSRSIKEPPWMPVPIRQGTHYRRLAFLRDGAQIYGTFMALVQVAAHCKPTRGVLADEKGPLSASDLAAKTLFPKRMIERTIEALSGEEIPWLVPTMLEQGSSSTGAGLEDGSGTSSSLSERERETEKKKKKNAPAWSGEAGWSGVTDADRTAWAAAYPACDVTLCLAQMGEWLASNPEKAHKHNWRRFVTNWLKREQDKGGTMPRGANRNGPHPKPAADARRADKAAGEYHEPEPTVRVVRANHVPAGGDPRGPQA